MSERTTTFAYIPHRDRAAYVAAGWIVTPMRLPHGLYSSIGEWVGDGEPVFPKPDGSAQ